MAPRPWPFGTRTRGAASPGALPRGNAGTQKALRRGTTRHGVFRTKRLPAVQSGGVHGEPTEAAAHPRTMPHRKGTGRIGYELAQCTVNPRRTTTGDAVVQDTATKDRKSTRLNSSH